LHNILDLKIFNNFSVLLQSNVLSTIFMRCHVVFRFLPFI